MSSCPPCSFVVVYASGVAYLNDFAGLRERLAYITEWDWYLDVPEAEIPSVWASVDGECFVQVNLSRTPLGDGLHHAEDAWRLVRSDSSEVLVELRTSYCPN